MNKGTRNWIFAAIGALACLLAIAGSVLFRDVRELYANSSWVAHTHEVLAALESLLSTISAAEAGQRGYLVTGEDEFLTNYQVAIDTYAKKYNLVQELTADNPEQKAQLPALKALLDERLTEMQRILQLRQTQGFEVARAALSEGRGRVTMTKIRSVVAQMLRREQDLLVDRQQLNNATYASAKTNAVLASALGIAALGVLWWLVQLHLQATERASAAIHKQRELLRAMLVSIGDAVIATDAEGRVTLLNTIAERLTGWREYEAIGKSLSTVFNIINEETRQPVTNPALVALREGRIVGLANHTILIAKSGTEWPLDDSAAPIRNAAGGVEGAILVFREISERKEQEATLLRQAAALEEADHRKDEFLATLAHELRNPIAPLSNALQIWPFVEDNRGELERLRTLMVRQVRQMTRLIDDLLDLSRITSGKVHLQKQPIEISMLINEALETVKPHLEAGSQQLTVALPAEPVYVDGDVARLTQVFGNILNNASKYTGRGGSVWVSATADNGQVIVKIRDNGPGIPASMLEDIFEIFRQGDGSLERAHGGLGIGLTLVKRLVIEHGGTVEAHSAGPGQGSEFVVTLPRLTMPTALCAEGDGTPRLQQFAGIAAHRVLVVDDIKASAHTLALMLQAIGQDVSEVYDGQSAIDWVLEKRPDVVFLDIAMPGMSGYDVARRLRREIPDIILIALTGYGQEEDRRKAIEAGFDEHLIKPTSLEMLRTILINRVQVQGAQSRPGESQAG